MTKDDILRLILISCCAFGFMGFVVLLARIWEALGEINAIHKKLFPEEYRSEDEGKD